MFGLIASSLIGGAISLFGQKSQQKHQEKMQRRAYEAEYQGMQEANRIMQEGANKASAAISSGAGSAAAAIMAGAKKQAGVIMERSGMAIDAQERYFAVADKKLDPIIQLGQNAGVEMASMLGIPGPDGKMRPYDIKKLEATPGYQWAFDQGQKAVEKSGMGTKLSGSQAKALTEYGHGMASQQFQNQFSNLNTLYQPGVDAAQTLAGLAVRTGEGIASTHRWTGSELSGIYGAEASGLASAHMAAGSAAAGAHMEGARGAARLAGMRADQTSSMYQQRAGQTSTGSMLAGIAAPIVGAAVKTGIQKYQINKDLNNAFSGAVTQDGTKLF
jgi:hypothetical protein